MATVGNLRVVVVQQELDGVLVSKADALDDPLHVRRHAWSRNSPELSASSAGTAQCPEMNK